MTGIRLDHEWAEAMYGAGPDYQIQRDVDGTLYLGGAAFAHADQVLLALAAVGAPCALGTCAQCAAEDAEL